LPAVKAKVRSAWKKFNKGKSPDEMPGHMKASVDEIDIEELGKHLCQSFKTRPQK
jgi:hypothetical protein